MGIRGIEMVEEKIYLNDIFKFDELLSQPKYRGKWIKVRFNKNWEDYNFVERYMENCSDFIPWILSRGGNRSRNQVGEIQFQFIEVEWHKWLFVGAYLIFEKDSQVHTNGVRYALAERLTEYDKYVDKLVLNWKNKSRAWFYTNRQIIDNEMEVYSLSSTSYFDKTIDFPGFENLSMTYESLRQHFYSKNWREQLSSVYGVYVLTDEKTGKLYVGSAYGENGLWGRWSTYLSNGYDQQELEDSRYPNKRLKELVNTKGISYIQKNFRYSVLEIFSKNEIGKQKALHREQYWKQVLSSRYPNGYNDN